MQTDSSHKSEFRTDVEGLRAVAVLLVLASHFYGVPAGGFIGVDVFFVISGYLITGLLVREQRATGRISFRDFYVRRIRRIMPAALLVIFATTIAAKLIFVGDRLTRTGDDGLWSLAFLANVRFASEGTDYFSKSLPPSPFQHYWSLAVEEQFYVVWPILLVLVFALGRSVTHRAGTAALSIVLPLIVATSLAWSVIQSTSAPTEAYFSTLTRGWELGAGALLSIHAGRASALPAAARRTLGWAGLTALLAGAVVIDETTRFPGYAALLPVLGTVALLAAGPVSKSPGGLLLLSRPSMRFVGRISYSLYLWHWPVVIFAAAVMPRTSATFRILVPLLSVALAIASFYLLEETIRRSGWLLKGRSRSSVKKHLRSVAVKNAALVSLAGVTGALALYTLNDGSLKPAAPPEIAAISLASPGASPEATRSIGPQATRLAAEITASAQVTEWKQLQPSVDQLAESGSPEWQQDGCLPVTAANEERCTYGDGPREVVILGDSVAAAWAPAIRDAAGAGARVRLFTTAECAVADTQTFIFGDKARKPNVFCQQNRERALSRIAEIKPDLVIAANDASSLTFQVAQSGPGARRATWTEAYTRTLERLKQSANQVVVLGGPPQGKPMQECVTAFSEPADCLTTLSRDFQADVGAERAAAETAQVAFIDTVSYFCTADGLCPAVVGQTPIRIDNKHLTAAYARRLAPVLSEQITAAGIRT